MKVLSREDCPVGLGRRRKSPSEISSEVLPEV